MEGKTLRWGIVGAGQIVSRWIRGARQAGIAVEAIAGRAPERAQAAAQAYGIPRVLSCEALVADEAIDIVYVATPHPAHKPWALEALRHGKHVLVEKPIAASVPEAEAMVESAKRHNCVFGVGHVERFNPAMDFLEKYAHETRFVEAHRLAKYPPPRPGLPRRGTEVSVVLDLMIHDIDLLLHMVGSEVERFDVVGIPVLSKTEDLVNARIKFVNGSCATLTASRVSQEPLRRFRVFQENSYISMDYGRHFGMVIKRNRIGLTRKDVNLDEKNALYSELDDFIGAVNTTKMTGKVCDPRIPGVEGLKALRLAVEIEQEARRYNDHYGFKFSPCSPSDFE